MSSFYLFAFSFPYSKPIMALVTSLPWQWWHTSTASSTEQQQSDVSSFQAFMIGTLYLLLYFVAPNRKLYEQNKNLLLKHLVFIKSFYGLARTEVLNGMDWRNCLATVERLVHLGILLCSKVSHTRTLYKLEEGLNGSGSKTGATGVWEQNRRTLWLNITFVSPLFTLVLSNWTYHGSLWWFLT